MQLWDSEEKYKLNEEANALNANKIKSLEAELKAHKLGILNNLPKALKMNQNLLDYGLPIDK